MSHQIRAIFADYTDLIEPLSLDEAYLDVTEDRRGLGSARAIAEDIRARIRAETGLTASAGVSYCKFIAKLASDQNKPDGLCVIPPHKGAAFVATLPVKRFHGVGPVTAAKMERLGILTGADLAQWPIEQLEAHFGISGRWYWRIARGIDEREVKPDRPYKSVSAERTFDVDYSRSRRSAARAERVAGYAWQRIERAEVRGRTVTLKVKFADFTLITRSKSFAVAGARSGRVRGRRAGAARGAAAGAQGHQAARPGPSFDLSRSTSPSPASWDWKFDKFSVI